MSPKKPERSKKSQQTKKPWNQNPRSDKLKVPTASGTFFGRDALAAYIANPASFSSSVVIYSNENFVAIHDLYPKSVIHALLLPRTPSHLLLKHPFEALNSDPEFLASVQAETKELKALVASELRRRYGKFSATEKAREEAMNSDNPPDELPPGRDWSQSIISGVHAGPSMNHIHVHVLSADMNSPCMKHRKHYNSFNTPFLVDVDDFPFAEEDLRLRYKEMKYLQEDLRCRKCGRGFEKDFDALKAHLGAEFEGWKKV